MGTNGDKAKNVVLAITGGIAAYKGADLTRKLREAGYEVRIVMTANAQAFITPLTLQALSGNPVRSALFDSAAEAAMGHIELARWADLVLIAPASANVMAKLAHGLADDLLTTLCLATPAPLALAPAMNQGMWRASATAANLRVLTERGVRIIGPAAGSQACGDIGPGRMLEPAEIVAEVNALLRESDHLAGTTVVVTAGPTREAIDPVRFVSNASSGKMGYAVAAAAAAAGAKTTLVSGPTTLDTPPGVERILVESAVEMHAAVMSKVATADIFIGAAAVGDYQPAQTHAEKIKKTASDLHLVMRRTPDILAEVARLEPAPFTVGFAAETHNVEANARAKLVGKSLDMIAANQVGVPGQGFAGEDNALVVLWSEGRQVLPLAPKTELARTLVEIIGERFREKDPD